MKHRHHLQTMLLAFTFWLAAVLFLPACACEEGHLLNASAQAAWQAYYQFLTDYKKAVAEGRPIAAGQYQVSQYSLDNGLKGTGYALCDLDQDGIPELFLGSPETLKVWEGYTYENGEVKTLFTSEGEQGYITTDNLYYVNYTHDSTVYDGWSRKIPGEAEMELLYADDFDTQTGKMRIYGPGHDGSVTQDESLKEMMTAHLQNDTKMQELDFLPLAYLQ